MLATEVSGVLGFQMLRLLDIKIDYRDGLVDFNYDAKRFNHRSRPFLTAKLESKNLFPSLRAFWHN